MAKVTKGISFDSDVVRTAERLAPGGNLSRYVNNAVREMNEKVEERLEEGIEENKKEEGGIEYERAVGRRKRVR